ncbi:unnamed protein product [Microthlaspi erraticum]|uniref:Uncharacterized protein n=1 Tax=Microthlaspi erraticum TaxID=1685480 RepID=A0A6D2HK65_9BRAS|nr:unnamed protein product [Microthlaspi erraticum]
MDNFLPFSYPNANFVEELPMDLNNNHSYFSTVPAYDQLHYQEQPQQFYQPSPNVAWPMEQTAMMNHQQLQYQPEVFPHQIPMTQTGSEFVSLAYNPAGFRQERGVFLDPHMKKMARINRKQAMIRSRNNPGSSSTSNELADSRRQLSLAMRNIDEAEAREDVYLYSSYDNKMLRVLLVKNLKNSDVGSLGRIVLPKYFSLSKPAGRQNVARQEEFPEVNEANSWEDMFMCDDDSFAMIMGNLNDDYPNPNSVMGGLTVDLDQNHQATSSLPPVDHVTVAQHVGSYNDDVNFNGFAGY